jgi:hypothetical protein
MSNISTDLSFVGANRKRFNDELVGFYSRMSFTHALTLCWNADVHPRLTAPRLSIERARRDIGMLLARIDRRLLGTRFHKKPDLRTNGVFFFEHVDRNLHAHALIRVQPGWLLDFHRLFPKDRGGAWNDIVPSGSYSLQIITDDWGAAGYAVKGQFLGADERMTVWAEDFFP